jgi:ribosomal protein S18 acetylase RimI-like enzyme
LNPTDPTRLERAGAIVDCSLVPWDSEIFGFQVAQITHVELAGDAQPEGVLDAFRDWCVARDVRLVSCRLDHRQLRESMALEDLGFRFVEMVYRPRLDRLEEIAPPKHALEVTEATPADGAAIQAVAATVFTTGRFLLDRRLPSELSDRRYASWVRTSLDSTDQTVLKAEVDGDLVGFFIVEHRPDGRVYWHLTAVAPAWQGKGIGMSLWRTMLLRHRAEGASSVETTVSGHNLAVINLYARLGFVFGDAQMTFHWLREAEALA